MKKYIKLILLVLWMAFIFYFSSLNSTSSSGQSNFIVNFILRYVNLNADILSLFIRKSAHIFEYFILYLLFSNYLMEYKIKNYTIVCILFSIIYSFTDEIHQLFVFGRAGMPQDILIDLIGIMLGFFIYHLYLKIIYKYKVLCTL